MEVACHKERWVTRGGKGSQGKEGNSSQGNDSGWSVVMHNRRGG